LLQPVISKGYFPRSPATPVEIAGGRSFVPVEDALRPDQVERVDQPHGREAIMGSPVVHFELQGPDPDGTAKFYSQIFGWHTESVPGEQPYVTVDTHAGKGINGGFGRTQAGQPANVAIYAAVPDLKASLKQAESLGAKTVVPYT